MEKRKIVKLIISTMMFMVLSTCISFAVGWVDDGGDNWRYVDRDGTYATDTIRSSGDGKYYLDVNGYMVRDYILEDYNGAVYYFDDTGKMVVNKWVVAENNQVYNQMDNPPSIYLYYFGNNGKAYQAKNDIVKKTIDGKKYLFNENGQMLSGWINESGDRYNEFDDDEMDPFEGYCYYAGDETDGVLREGWTAWEGGSTKDRYYQRERLWFYFKTNDNKKIQSNNADALLKKTINGKTYGFDENGVMAEGWDAEALDPNNEDATIEAKKYFKEAGEDAGRLTKKEWVFAVPSQKQNLDDHDQETERWFYALGGGEVVKGVMRKINKDYYAFNESGIMKTGLCVIDKTTREFVDCIDAEKTEGKDFIISRHYISVDNSSAAREYEVFDDENQLIYYFEDDETKTADFGKRKFLTATIAFGDDDYEFTSQSKGEYEGLKNKKYYQAGVKLAADDSIGLGLVFAGYCNSPHADKVDIEPIYYNSTHAFAKEDKNHVNSDGSYVKSDYIVLRDLDDCQTYGVYPVYYAVDSNGRKITKRNYAKKDKTGNYWLIGENATVMGIYEVPIKYKKSGGTGVWQFKSEFTVGDKVKTAWRDFGTPDEYGKTCGATRDNIGDYALYLNEVYSLNFRYAD